MIGNKASNFLVRKQQTNHRSIHDAVRCGDVVQLEYMVKNGAGINEVENETKFTPMHCACYMGALEVHFFGVCHNASFTLIIPHCVIINIKLFL